MMTHAEFVALAKQMRELQKRYFRSRDPAALRESKDAERRLDAAVEAFEEAARPTEPDLFSEENQDP